MNARWNLTSFLVPFCRVSLLWKHSSAVFVRLKCYIHIVAESSCSNSLTDWTAQCCLFSPTPFVFILHCWDRSAQRWQIGATHSESKSPDIHLQMLWQLVNLFILQEAMEVDRVSWSSCLQAFPLSTWLPALSRRLNSSWWAITCRVKVQQGHWPFSWPLPPSCL